MVKEPLCLHMLKTIMLIQVKHDTVVPKDCFHVDNPGIL